MSRSRLVSAVLVAGIAACAGDSTDPGPDNGSSIAISPGVLTLNVGGRGTLSATVRDAAGAVVSTPVTWVTRNPLVAAIDNGGSVTGIAVGQTMAVATASGKRDSVLVIVLDDLTLEVVPAVGSVQVGRALQFSVVARNGAGQVIATPAVTWASSSQAIATISAAGNATGVARGVTSITAAARGVTSPPAALTVTDATSSCDGIASVPAWDATADYAYATRGTSEGGILIDSDNKGSAKTTLTVQSVIEPLLVWKGKLAGTASLHETRTGGAGDVTKLDGGGPLVDAPGGAEPTMTLIVDTRTCTYKLTVITNLSLTRTEPSGAKSNQDTPVALFQVGQTTALGAWKQLGLSDLGEGAYPGHSTVWAGFHPEKNAFVPLGFATALMAQSADEPQVGSATVSYAVTVKR